MDQRKGRWGGREHFMQGLGFTSCQISSKWGLRGLAVYEERLWGWGQGVPWVKNVVMARSNAKRYEGRFRGWGHE